MVTIALSTIPALLYTFIERGILHLNTGVLGARYGSYVPESNSEAMLTENAAFGCSHCWPWKP
jgi:hypothetical protein